MSEIQHGPAMGQGSDPSRARACLTHFLEAASALHEAWSPILELPTYPRYLPSFDHVVRDLEAWRDEVEDRPYREPPKPLDLTDSSAVRAWLTDLHKNIKDAIAAGDDATRPPGERDLGRRTAREHILEAHRSLRLLIEAARRGLPAKPEA